MRSLATGRPSQKERAVSGAVAKAVRAGEFVEDVCVQIENVAETHSGGGAAVLALLEGEFHVRVREERESSV